VHAPRRGCATATVRHTTGMWLVVRMLVVILIVIFVVIVVLVLVPAVVLAISLIFVVLVITVMTVVMRFGFRVIDSWFGIGSLIERLTSGRRTATVVHQTCMTTTIECLWQIRGPRIVLLTAVNQAVSVAGAVRLPRHHLIFP